MDDKYYGHKRKVKAIRIRDDIHHKARVAALTARMTFGEWIEEAIIEKMERNSDSSRVFSKDLKRDGHGQAS